MDCSVETSQYVARLKKEREQGKLHLEELISYNDGARIREICKLLLLLSSCKGKLNLCIDYAT